MQPVCYQQVAEPQVIGLVRERGIAADQDQASGGLDRADKGQRVQQDLDMASGSWPSSRMRFPAIRAGHASIPISCHGWCGCLRGRMPTRGLAGSRGRKPCRGAGCCGADDLWAAIAGRLSRQSRLRPSNSPQGRLGSWLTRWLRSQSYLSDGPGMVRPQISVVTVCSGCVTQITNPDQGQRRLSSDRP